MMTRRLWLSLLAALLFLAGWPGMPACLPAADDDLAPLIGSEAEALRQQMRRTSQLPAGETIKALADAPILIWSERCFLGTNDAISGDGFRYLVVRLAIGNLTDGELVLRRDKIFLHAGPRTLAVSPRMQRDVMLEIDWRANGHVVPHSHLATPRVINIERGKSAEFWCVFVGLDAMPATPPLTLKVEFNGGQHAELDLNVQQKARLGLTKQRLGPENVLSALTIHGQLNRVNAEALAAELNNQFEQGARRFLIEWAPQARPSDDLLLNWLLSSTSSGGRENLLYLQLPVLPPLRRIVLAQPPEGNREVLEWENASGKVFSRTADAAAAALTDLFERADPAVVLRELRSGHPWSQRAALSAAGDGLGPEALPILEQLAEAKDPELRRAAIRALGSQNDPAADERLRHWLSRGDADGEAAFSALLADPTPEHRRLILAYLGRTPSPLVRVTLLKLLAEAYHPAWDGYLGDCVRDPDPQVRRAALLALHRLGRPDLSELCVQALRDPDRSVQEAAFAALVDRTDRASEQASVNYALAELREGRQTEAELALLERLCETRAAPLVLDQILHTPAPKFRLIEVLGALGSDEHIRALLGRAPQLSPEEQAAALQLATRLSLPEQLEFARQAARSKEAPVREAALDLLKTMDDDDAIAVFDQMLQAAAAQESESICIALGEMGSAKAIRLLRDYQERAARKENASALSAAEHGLNVWRSRRPGWNYVQQGHEHQFREKKEAEALKYYTVAITINPDLGDAYSARAGIRLHQNKLDQAAADFRRALELDAFDHQAVTGLAIVLAMQGDWQQAVQFVADQAGHFPRNEYFAYNSACVCGRAIETLRKQPASEERDRVIAQLQTQAIERLRTALSLGFNQFAWMKEDPDLISLHDLPAFQQLQRTD